MLLYGCYSLDSVCSLYTKKDQSIPTETLTAGDNLCRVRWSKEKKKKKTKIQNNSLFSLRCQNCAHWLYLIQLFCYVQKKLKAKEKLEKI